MLYKRAKVRGVHFTAHNMHAFSYIQKVDTLCINVAACHQKLGEAADQMQILCELELPTEEAEAQLLIDSINTKYNGIMR